MSAAPTPPSWNDLALRLRPFIRRRVASDPDADDVLQETLLRMHRGLPALKDDDHLGPWMYRVARSAISDHLRSRQRHPLPARHGGEDRLQPPDAGDETHPFAEDDDAVAREVATYLSFFVALLPSPYREAITLTELEGRTQKGAAEMLGISHSAMKSRVQRGRERLRVMLESCCEVAVDARGKVIACMPRPLGEIPANCCS